MKLNRRYQDMLCFARFCQRENVDPADVAQLCQLAKRRAALAALICSNREDATPANDARDDKLLAQIREISARMGMKFDLPGLYPSFTKDGKDIHLPY